MTMLQLLPSITSKKYSTSALRASDLASNLTTASDEAFLYWLLSIYSTKWSGCGEEDENDDENTPPAKKKQKTRTHQDLFCHLYNIVLEARNDDKNQGLGWDEALKVEAEAERQSSKVGMGQGVEETIGNHPSPKNERDIYVARYSPGKAMRYEKVKVPDSVSV